MKLDEIGMPELEGGFWEVMEVDRSLYLRMYLLRHMEHRLECETKLIDLYRNGVPTQLRGPEIKAAAVRLLEAYDTAQQNRQWIGTVGLEEENR